MARLVLGDGDLTVQLSGWEKLAAFRGDVSVSLSGIRAVSVESEPFKSLRGIRAPGTGWPDVIAYGVRRYPGGRDFVAVLGRKPAVRVDLDPSDSLFARLLVTADDAEQVVARIRSAAGL